MIVKFGLKQLINSPTRTTKRSSSIINHIYTACSDKLKSSFVSHLAISDHYPVCCKYLDSIKKRKLTTISQLSTDPLKNSMNKHFVLLYYLQV